MARGQRKIPLITTNDLPTEQDLGITLTEIGGGVEITRDDIQVVQPNKMIDLAKQEKFMNEFVVINIQPDDDAHAPEFIYAGHNGIAQYVHRGTDQRIRRKYLYSLVAGKKKQYTCAFGKDNSGNEFNRLNGKSSGTYRLSIIEDTPEGQKSFRQWMQEP